MIISGLALFMFFIYVHSKFGSLLVLCKSCRQLYTWQKAQAVITSCEETSWSHSKNYSLNYEFTTADGQQQKGYAAVPVPGLLEEPVSYHTGESLEVLYHPENSSRCKLMAELQKAGFLQKDGCHLKSEKQLRKELLLYAILCLAAWGMGIALGIYEYNIDFLTAIPDYLFVCMIFVGIGALSVIRYRGRSLV